MATLVSEYTLWKDVPWYHQVNWPEVSGVVDEVLQHVCRDGVVVRDDLLTQLAPIESTLDPTDAEGLASLVCEPIQITRNQLHNGGHRTAAMLAQGVQFVPAACMRADIGRGVDASQVYPVQDTSLGIGLIPEEPE